MIPLNLGLILQPYFRRSTVTKHGINTSEFFRSIYTLTYTVMIHFKISDRNTFFLNKIHTDGKQNCNNLNMFVWFMSRVFANGPGDQGSIPGRVIPNTQRMVLDATLLNTQHYKVRIKGKVEQSREWSSAFLYTLV